MKCKICGRKTDWDSSYGRENFIVCPICHHEMTNTIDKLKKENCPSDLIATMLIINIGIKREERKK